MPAATRWLFSDSAQAPALLTSATATAQMEGTFGTAPAQGAGGAYAQFKSAFQSATGMNPSTIPFAAHSYDAMFLLELAAAWAAGPGPSYRPITGIGLAQGLAQVSAPGGPTFKLDPADFEAAVHQLQNGVAINIDGASGPLILTPATGEALSDYAVSARERRRHPTSGALAASGRRYLLDFRSPARPWARGFRLG